MTFTLPQDGDRAWKITAHSVRFIESNTIVEAEGNVVITDGVATLKTDFLRFFTQTNWFYLRGNIQATFHDTMHVIAQTAELEKNTLTGWLYGAHVTLKKPYIVANGDVLERKGDNKYLFKNVTVTACDAEVPPWKFSARLLDLRIDGYTILQDTTLYLYDITTLTIPTAVFPANTSRQTGFLLPSLSFSTSEGFALGIPFFWAINEQQDLLTNIDMMTKKGFMFGARYRGWYTPKQKVWLAGNWLYEINLEDLVSPVTQKRYTPSHNRYWLRGMFNTELGASSWHLRADLDYASDLAFMSDYKSGLLGFNATMDENFNWFGRELHPLRQNRVSKVLVEREYNRFGLAFSASYEQDLLSQQNALTQTDSLGAHHLPSAELYLYRQKLFGDTSLATYLPFEVHTDFGVGYFMNTTDAASLARINFTPNITLPLNFDYISVEPSVAVHQRAYFDVVSTKKYTELHQNNRYIAVPEAKIDISSTIARTYAIHPRTELTDIGSTRWVGLMHTIKPWIRYTYRPEIDQSSTPAFLFEDYIEATNGITYGFNTSLVRKRERLDVSSDQKGNLSTAREYDYLRFLTLDIEQTYYFAPNKLQNNKYFSPLSIDLKYYFDDYLSLRTLFDIDTTYGELSKANISLTYTYKDFRIEAGYDYQLQAPHYLQYFKVNSLFIKMETPVFFYMQAAIRYAHDIDRNKPSEIQAELRYVNQCYSIGLRYTQDFFDTSVTLLFSIPLL